MGGLKLRFVRVLQIAVLVPLLLAGGFAAPASAQIMKRDGFTIPWLHSAAERRAREACQNNQPDCRPSVRKDIADEKAISLITPWLIMGGIILGALIWLRKREQEKVKKRRQAQRKHDPKAFKKLDQSKEDRDAETARDADY
jgi:preprotein translocase subunit Sec63